MDKEKKHFKISCFIDVFYGFLILLIICAFVAFGLMIKKSVTSDYKKINERFDYIDSKIEFLEKEVDSLKKDFVFLGNKVNVCVEKIQENAESIDKVVVRIDDVESAINKQDFDKALSTLQKRIDNFDSKLNQFEMDIEDYLFIYSDSYFTYTLTDTRSFNCKLKKNVNPTSVKIWSTLFEYPVFIDYGCFENCTSLEVVEIEEGISAIPSRCFSNCSLLKECKLPLTILEIGLYAFENCYSLEYIYLPQYLNMLNSSAFYGSGLKQVECFRSFFTKDDFVLGDDRNLDIISYLDGSLIDYSNDGLVHSVNESLVCTDLMSMISGASMALSYNSSCGVLRFGARVNKSLYDDIVNGRYACYMLFAPLSSFNEVNINDFYYLDWVNVFKEKDVDYKLKEVELDSFKLDSKTGNYTLGVNFLVAVSNYNVKYVGIACIKDLEHSDYNRYYYAQTSRYQSYRTLARSFSYVVGSALNSVAMNLITYSESQIEALSKYAEDIVDYSSDGVINGDMVKCHLYLSDVFRFYYLGTKNKVEIDFFPSSIDYPICYVSSNPMVFRVTSPDNILVAGSSIIDIIPVSKGTAELYVYYGGVKYVRNVVIR